jgi:hypothetical protein
VRDRDHDQPGRPQQRARDLPAGRALAQRQPGDDQGEDDLGLQDQRRQTGRHPELQADVQQAELAQAHEGADRDHGPPARGGAGHDEDQREGDQGEPDRDQQQRRHAGQPLVDDHEVDAPDHGDQDGERAVLGGHRTSIRAKSMKHQRWFLDISR